MGSDHLLINARIGETLRNLRVAKGLHLNAAHEIRKIHGVKIDPSYLSRMERGKAEIPLRTLNAIGLYYSISIADIIRLSLGETSETPDSSVLLRNPKMNEALGVISGKLGEKRAIELITGYLNEIARIIEEADSRPDTLKAASPDAKKRIKKLRF